MYPHEKLSLYNDKERQICSKGAFQLKHLSANPTESDQMVIDDYLVDNDNGNDTDNDNDKSNKIRPDLMEGEG